MLAAYRAAHPDAPRVVVGDISFRDGGPMDEHVSHQNGLDVDVYYPRLDRHLSAPIATSQIDRRLAQDLLDRFVAAGAQTVFVGYSTGLHGPSGVVVPYPNHENHMHVRFPPPRAEQAPASTTAGWRCTAVTIGNADDFDWAQVAGFDAEFCALGGKIVKRIWLPQRETNFSGLVAEQDDTGLREADTAPLGALIRPS